MLARLAPVLLIACGDPAAHVQLAPLDLGGCGMPAGAQGLNVTAYAESGTTVRAVAEGGEVDIADFPADTVQLGVEVLVANGVVGAAGKTAPLDFASLASGAAIPIAMVPPDGFCPTGPLGTARAEPLVARAGDAVLVVGGTDASGPLATAELYDPATATFSPVDVPSGAIDMDTGLLGTVLTPLPDGRVVLTGGSRGILTVFDPATKKFGPAIAITRRAFHAAIATDATHVLVAGGCAGVVGQTCDATPLHSSFVYDLEGTQGGGPTLPGVHEGATLFDLGPRADGAHQLAIAGGFGDPGAGEWLAVDDDQAMPLANLAAQAAPLDGGALVTAFAADGAAATGTVAIVSSRGTVALATPAPALTGARLVLVEDGGIVAIGGGSQIVHYSPSTDRWTQGPAAPVVASPSLVRLADGTVLVLGGAAPSAQAWLYRPSLVGPTTGSLTVLPASNGVLTAPDPATLDRTAGFTLAAPDDTTLARGLVGGPRPTYGSVQATVHGAAVGIALIAQQQGSDHAIVAQLRDGEAARLERHDPGVTTLCTGSTVSLDSGPLVATLEINSERAQVSLGMTAVLSCDISLADAGLWGVAASGAGSRVTVDAVTVAR